MRLNINRKLQKVMIKTLGKKVVAGILAVVMLVSMIRIDCVFAQDVEIYPYTIFAGSAEEGAISVYSSGLNMNGVMAANGSVVSTCSMNINGGIKENIGENMPYYFGRLDWQYFQEDKSYISYEDYELVDNNLNINSPQVCYENLTLKGNLSLSAGLKAYRNLTLNGQNININNAVVMSKYGDVDISGQNVSITGLIYAPFGDLTISAQSINLNNVVIIAETVTLNGGNINVNYNGRIAEFLGYESEGLHLPFDDYVYLPDADGDRLPYAIEEYMGTDSNKTDSDGDGLPDGYEVIDLYTNPTHSDTDENGVIDSDEDFDNDGLSNIREFESNTYPYVKDSDDDGVYDGQEVIEIGSNPLSSDTDGDTLCDGDEVVLGLSPVVVDTDLDGIKDSAERFLQTFVHQVKNECEIEEVTLTMNATGTLESTTQIESIMNVDVDSSNVPGLIGEPFEITTTSDFEECTISFKLKEETLDCSLEDIIFLWYDEENQKMEILETTYDYQNCSVSTVVNHFSRYMIVDKQDWFDAWREELNYGSATALDTASKTVIAVDCSGSMYENDPIDPDSKNDENSPNECERYYAAYYFIQTMGIYDKVGIVTFNDSATVSCELTSTKSSLRAGISNFTSAGGTDFDSALTTSIDMLKNEGETTKKNIILLSDGESSVSNTVLSKAKASGIKIYTVGLGDCDDVVLQSIATKTGGEFFEAYSAKELVEIYGRIGMGDDFDKTDTDGDGLPDVIETAGIRTFIGTTYTTDPTNPDTDGDGLMDGEEVNPELKCRVYDLTAFGLGIVRSYYFTSISNPNKVDSDGDGYSDAEEVEIHKSNPRENEVTLYTLSEDFISVYYTGDEDWHNSTNHSRTSISYGGNQEWFFNNNY